MDGVLARVLKSLYKLNKCRVKNRLNEFKQLKEQEQQMEFIFCLLTPQSNAQRCWEAVEQIFLSREKQEEKLREILKPKTRFHNNKAKYVSESFKSWNKIQSKIKETNIVELRNWLADNVKGYGLKEASHFLRNIGKSQNKIAILDRHILKNMKEAKVIEDTKIKGRKDYLNKEQAFLKFASILGIFPDELDLVLWSKENGEVFK